jgi:hypothetical protein
LCYSSVGLVRLESLYNYLHSASCSSTNPISIREAEVCQGRTRRTAHLLDYRQSVGLVSLERLNNSLYAPQINSLVSILVRVIKEFDKILITVPVPLHHVVAHVGFDGRKDGLDASSMPLCVYWHV